MSRYAVMVRAAREALGEDGYQEACDAGHRLTLKQNVALAQEVAATLPRETEEQGQ